MLISLHNWVGVWGGVRQRFAGKEHVIPRGVFIAHHFTKLHYTLLLHYKTLGNRADTDWHINPEMCIFINASCFFLLFHFLLSTFHSLCCLQRVVLQIVVHSISNMTSRCRTLKVLLMRDKTTYRSIPCLLSVKLFIWDVIVDKTLAARDGCRTIFLYLF